MVPATDRSGNEDVLERLTVRSAILSLQELTEELATSDPVQTALNADEARHLLAALSAAARTDSGLAARAAAGDQSLDLTAPNLAAPDTVRRVLAHLATDPDIAEAVRTILSDPPTDDQMAVEAAVTSVVVLAALVSWLQTKISIKVSRKDGKTDFSFELGKAAAPPGLLRDLVATLARMLSGSPKD